MKNAKPPHIRQKDWDDVDSPSLTKAWFKRARPAREVDPELVAAHKRGDLHLPGKRGAQKKPTKKLVSLRLSQDVLTHFKSTGEGWQTRIDDVLRSVLIAVGK